MDPSSLSVRCTGTPPIPRVARILSAIRATDKVKQGRKYMYIYKKKVVLSLVSLGVMLVSLALTSGLLAKGVHSIFAQSTGAAVTHFDIPTAQQPSCTAI